MNNKFYAVLVILLWGFALQGAAQKNPDWEKWEWLIGDWIGEGSGKTGEGTGQFSIKKDLDGKVLIRKNHAVYPATRAKPKIVHDDLMIIYKDMSDNLPKAMYFDNEGHAIPYLVTYAEKAIVLTSKSVANYPVFRLTYSLLEKGLINVKFEMSQDGGKFRTYTEGTCKKGKVRRKTRE